jgi:hypothetical protein
VPVVVTIKRSKENKKLYHETNESLPNLSR